MNTMLILCCLVVAGEDLPSVEQGKQPVRVVSAEDLSSGRCQINGLLGKPYGSVMRVSGIWEGWEFGSHKLPVGEKPFSLRITEVDGKKLAPQQQVVIDAVYINWLKARQGIPLRGERVEGRVFESGGYVRRPEAVDKILGVPESQDFFRFRFYSFLYFIDYKSLGGGEKAKASGTTPAEPLENPNGTSGGNGLLPSPEGGGDHTSESERHHHKTKAPNNSRRGRSGWLTPQT